MDDRELRLSCLSMAHDVGARRPVSAADLTARAAELLAFALGDPQPEEKPKPSPVGYIEEEGDEMVPWVDVEDFVAGKGRNAKKAHAIYFADGNVFDMVSGWRKNAA